MNNSDLFVCRMQGELFEKSLDKVECGSASFIRNYMNSDIASYIDSSNIGLDTLEINRIFNEYIKQYGNKKYGKRKFSAKALYWIGYIYRLWSILYKQSSKSIYKIINGTEMNNLYAPYHTLSSEKAIQNILESKNKPAVINDDYLEKVMRKYLGFK